MKTRYWVAILAAVMVICAGASLWLFRSGDTAVAVKIISEGKVLHTLPLSEDTRLEIVSSKGKNVVTVRGGKVAVTEADCPDHYCMDRGFCDRGAQIVCLPNRLVLEFVGNRTVDGVSG